MYEMLRNLEPPVGFGRKCPYRLAYRVTIDFDLFFLIQYNFVGSFPSSLPNLFFACATPNSRLNGIIFASLGRHSN